MLCPNCGKEIPEKSTVCKKCGEVIREVSSSNETLEYIKKEKEKSAARQKKLEEKLAKQTERQAAKNSKAKKPINKKAVIIAIIAFAVVAAGVVFSLFHFDIIGKKDDDSNEKKNPALEIEYTYKEATAQSTPLALGDIRISGEEYEFFFRQSYSTVQNNSQLQFREYVSNTLGEGYSDSVDYYDEYFNEYFEKNANVFDYKKPIDKQNSKASDSSGNQVSWQEYIREDAFETMLGYRVKFALAKKMGLELTDDVRLQVYDHIEGLRSAVIEGGYPSLTQYLKTLFGEGCDEEFFKNELIREYMALKYDTVISQTYIKEYSNEEIEKEYKENYKEYDFTDLHVYEVQGENAEQNAQKIAEQSKDQESFSKAIASVVNESADKTSYPIVPKYYIDENYTAQLGDWAYDKARKENDVNVFKTQKGYTVVLVQAPVYTLENCVSYREIVLNKTDSNGVALTGEELKAVSDKAQSIYDEWKNAQADETSFTYYVIAHSQGSSASTGGFYPCATASDMNEEVKGWATNKERKNGDCEIIESADAYRLIYFIDAIGDYWNFSVRNEKASKRIDSELKHAKTGTYARSCEEGILEEGEKDFIDSINKIYLGIKESD